MITQNRILWLPNGTEDRHVSWDDVSPTSSRNPSGIRVDSDTALQSTVVLACARVLAESIAALPLHIYEYAAGGGKSPAKTHPIYRLLHTAPNSWQTSFEWREQQVLWLALWGNAYNLIVPGKSGFATELWPLHPSRMKPERVETGRIRYRYRDENGREQLYTQDQIMHIRWLSDDGLEGMIPVQLARDAIGLARACEIHGARFFGNGARPGFVLTTENDMKPEAASMLRDNWERMHRGADRASRTAVLFGGLKPVELGGSNNQESQFLETRRFQIEEVCRLYRCPPHLVGDLSRSSFSNIEQQSIDFVQHTLLPWLRRFENAFARDLIVEDDKYFAEFDTRGLLRGDAAARASYYSSLYNLGVASINEIRAWENLNPVDGGDLRFVGLSMQTLQQANAAAQAPAEAEAAPAPEEPPAPEMPTADVGGILAIVDQVSKGAVTPEAAKAIFASVFPQMPEGISDSIIAGAVIKKPEPPPVAPAPPGAAPPALPAPPGEKASRAFCPTGPGGGVDNSCSSRAGSGYGTIPLAADLEKVKNLGGSTGAMLSKGPDGKLYVVKSGNSPEHIRAESAANDIYSAAGVPVPRTRLDTSDPDEPKQIAEYAENARPLGAVRGREREVAIAEIQKGFVVDALLANWDVVGLEEDNILVPQSGPPLRVDNGGSLQFRAQGAEKNFGPTVGELETLRESEQGEPIFGSLSDSDVAAQIREVIVRREAILGATPSELRETMSERLRYVEEWARAREERERRRSFSAIERFAMARSQEEQRAFCSTGEGGGIDNSCSSKDGGGGSDSGSSGGKEKTTKCDPCHAPNVEKDSDRDGVTDAARVGVAAKDVPPPPGLAQLPNLAPREREAELEFMSEFERDPDGVADRFRDLAVSAGKPPTFGTDDAKILADEWAAENLDERAENRATLNTALHQTANAIAKRAFVQHLDTLKPGDSILVTVGGCGAGKGYAIKNNPEVLEMKNNAAAVWDSAGDQNATENPWILSEAESRGLKVAYVYVHADPKTQWADPNRGVVQRASDPKDGRMVDARVFADSYAIGAQNHHAFHQANLDNPNTTFRFIDNTGSKPTPIDGVPESARSIDRKELARFAEKTVEEANVPQRVKDGALAGRRIWGPIDGDGDGVVNEEEKNKGKK